MCVNANSFSYQCLFALQCLIPKHRQQDDIHPVALSALYRNSVVYPACCAVQEIPIFLNDNVP